MTTLRALLCTVILLPLNFYLIGQISQKKEEIFKHVFDHAKPEMTQYQIDSLYELAESHLEENQARINALILESQKMHKNPNTIKSDDCSQSNWGFENGNTSNWVTSGCVDMQNGGIDTYSGLPKVFNGNFSLKLSNDMDYNCLNAAAARTYSVPASGQTFITIHFAVSIFNFPHYSDQAANFNFNLYDNQLNALPCPAYQAYFSYDQGPVGIPSLQQTPFPATNYNPMVAGDLFYNSNVSFSNWHHVTIDLTQYAGTDVTMVFENRWCAFDVDWIYTYIEVDCPINNSEPVPVCLEDEEVELCAPQSILATYDWEFNNVSLSNTNQCIMANNQGTYTLNFRPVYLECADTSYEMNFVIIDKPVANFTVDEFCEGKPIIITNLSEFGFNYKWIYNGQEIEENIPNLIYEEGEDNLVLIAITGGCSDTIIKPLVVRKNPNPKFDFLDRCVGSPYKIINLSTDPENGPLDVNWHISTNYQSTNWNPEYTPMNDQSFIIDLKVINQYGCSVGIQAKAKPHPLPVAKFYKNEEVVSENTALVYFQDESSSDVNAWQWEIDNQNIYNGSNFYHEFNAPGTYTVNLIVFNEFACSDTTFSQISVNPSLTVFVPNTFTPNGDENNQLFYPVFSGSNFERTNYSFRVYNRWGEVVFQTSNIQDAWDGLHKGKPCMQGTYSWELGYVEKSSQTLKHLRGHVNIVR